MSSTKLSLAQIFESIGTPESVASGRPRYGVRAISDYRHYFVGKDSDERACFLIATRVARDARQAPVRLEQLDVQFDVQCSIKSSTKSEREGTFTVVRCRAINTETIRYFFSVCEALLRLLSDPPSRSEIAVAVRRLVAIFEPLSLPASRSVNGLFGELFVLDKSAVAADALAAWRSGVNSRFDFVSGGARLDVKATSGRRRLHTMSFEQCNPPRGSVAVIASMYVERASSGPSLGSLIERIEDRVSGSEDLLIKLYENVASTLGRGLVEALKYRFDARLAESSLAFYLAIDIPAIRGLLPAGVSDVHFRSDLSSVTALSVEQVIDREDGFSKVLPTVSDCR